MNRFIFAVLTIIALPAFAQKLSKRVIHNNTSSYRQLTAVHAGAVPDKAGIGQHFHHTIEEMYVILDGEAEFTINGRTSKIKGPVAVPCKLGDSHGVYNSSGKTLRWLNFAVSN